MWTVCLTSYVSMARMSHVPCSMSMCIAFHDPGASLADSTLIVYTLSCCKIVNTSLTYHLLGALGRVGRVTFLA